MCHRPWSFVQLSDRFRAGWKPLHPPLSDILGLRDLLAGYLGLPETGYGRPLFSGQGLRDTDVVTPEALRFAAVPAAKRQPVTLKIYPTDHSATVNASLPDAVPFVRGLFGCACRFLARVIHAERPGFGAPCGLVSAMVTPMSRTSVRTLRPASSGPRTWNASAPCGSAAPLTECACIADIPV